MLVLSRKVGEDILIGDGSVVVRVVRIGGGRVRIGIDAPPEVSVNRREVFELIQQENQHGLSATPVVVER